MTNQGSAERVKRRRAGERVYVVSFDVVSLLFVGLVSFVLLFLCFISNPCGKHLISIISMGGAGKQEDRGG